MQKHHTSRITRMPGRRSLLDAWWTRTTFAFARVHPWAWVLRGPPSNCDPEVCNMLVKTGASDRASVWTFAIFKSLTSHQDISVKVYVESTILWLYFYIYIYIYIKLCMFEHAIGYYFKTYIAILCIDSLEHLGTIRFSISRGVAGTTGEAWPFGWFQVVVKVAKKTGFRKRWESRVQNSWVTDQNPHICKTWSMWTMRLKCLCEPLGMGNLWGEPLLREQGGWKRWRSTRLLSFLKFNSMTFDVTFWKCSKGKTKKFITRYLVSSICYFQPENWGRFPFWLVFFKWVETTN